MPGMAYKHSRKTQLALLACSLLVAEGTEWTPSTFPNPSTASGAAACGRNVDRSAICDPDGIITRESANVVRFPVFSSVRKLPFLLAWNALFSVSSSPARCNVSENEFSIYSVYDCRKARARKPHWTGDNKLSTHVLARRWKGRSRTSRTRSIRIEAMAACSTAQTCPAIR